MNKDSHLIFEQYVTMNEGWKDLVAAGAVSLASLAQPSANAANAATAPQTLNINRTNYTQLINDLRPQLAEHEGYREAVYLDSRKIPTIGIGYNLTNKSAKSDLSSIGANLNDVLRGQRLNKQQIYKLFEISINRAIKDAKSYFPEYDSLPHQAKLVIADMAFNLGLTKLNKFEELNKALRAGDYIRAAKEMKNSEWYKQVKNRAINLVNQMKSVARGNSASSIQPLPTTANANEKQIIIKQGDTLSKIASMNKISLKELMNVNPQIKNPNRISIGQRINLP